jgi:DNA primase small subunit
VIFESLKKGKKQLIARHVRIKNKQADTQSILLSLKKSMDERRLKAYWTEQYPCEALVMMLTRNGDSLQHFEFAFECQSISNGEVFMQRYQSFKDADELKNALRARSDRSVILKLHIGACWNGVPKKTVDAEFGVGHRNHDLDRLRPVRAPLRIDVDLTDYTPDLTSYLPVGIKKDDVQANDLHWPLLDVAVRVTKRILKDCFGMDEVLSFYSGRRGVHIWVLDERAWQMDDEARATMIEFMSCPLDCFGVAKDTFLDRTPWYSEIYHEEILNRFVDLLKYSEMDLFSSTVSVTMFQQMMRVKHPEVDRVFRSLKMIESELAHVKFKMLTDVLDDLANKNAESYAWMLRRLQAAVLTLLWPRFDKGASTKLNHLIKAPFSVHSSTQRVAVPLRDDFANFCPEDVPTIGCEEHLIHDAEGDFRDQLANLGTPKPWMDPTEAWYMRWTPGAIDPVLEEVQSYEEAERRAKRRKLGIDDGISTMEYVASRNMWAVRVSRAFDMCIEDEHLHMRTQLCKIKGKAGRPVKVAVRKRIDWTHSTPVGDLWSDMESMMGKARIGKWMQVLEDDVLLLFEAGHNFCKKTKKHVEKKTHAILKRSQDKDLSGHVSVKIQDNKYRMWKAAFPEVVRLWPVPGVVEL